jgi:hypothetical protein
LAQLILIHGHENHSILLSIYVVLLRQIEDYVFSLT